MEVVEVAKDMFEKVPKEEKDINKIVRPSVTYWQDAWRRLKENKLAMLGLVIVIVVILVSIFGPMLTKYNYYNQDFNVQNQGPSSAHIFGTDALGRDMFVRVLYGGRISLAVGFAASIINLVLGVIYGGIAGFYGGMLDEFMMRIVDVIYSLPTTIYVILMMIVFGAGLKTIILAIGIISWYSMARIVRAQVLTLKQQEFTLAAKTLGASDARIILRHLIPNSMGPIIVTLTLGIPSAIFTEAFLSFIGLGVSAPMASWGTLCSSALDSYLIYPYQLFFPAVAICLTIFGFNLLGDGLRDALDPKMRK